MYSFFLFAVNVICIYVAALLMLKIKDVVPMMGQSVHWEACVDSVYMFCGSLITGSPGLLHAPASEDAWQPSRGLGHDRLCLAESHCTWRRLLMALAEASECTE